MVGSRPGERADLEKVLQAFPLTSLLTSDPLSSSPHSCLPLCLLPYAYSVAGPWGPDDGVGTGVLDRLLSLVLLTCQPRG